MKYVLRLNGAVLSGFYPNDLPERFYSKVDHDIHIRFSNILSCERGCATIFDTEAEAEEYRAYILREIADENNKARYAAVDRSAPRLLMERAQLLKVGKVA